MNTSRRLSGFALATLLLVLTAGCFRGTPSDKPPIHVIGDMDSQPKYKAQEENRFFADKAAMREPVPGTVPFGGLRADSAYYFGIDGKGGFVAENQAEVTPQLLERGRERFNIYCSPCHSRVGDGRGIIVNRGYTPPPSFHTDRARNFPDGQIFEIIAHGVRTMPAYGDQIKAADRWAIIAYMRALQRSQNATLDDIPPEMRDRIR
jgi:mono/diheme cytochrome c family protein